MNSTTYPIIKEQFKSLTKRKNEYREQLQKIKADLKLETIDTKQYELLKEQYSLNVKLQLIYKELNSNIIYIDTTNNNKEQKIFYKNLKQSIAKKRIDKGLERQRKKNMGFCLIPIKI